jgi:hypothetical protein
MATRCQINTFTLILAFDSVLTSLKAKTQRLQKEKMMKRLTLIVFAVALCFAVQSAKADVKIVNDVKAMMNGKDQGSGENISYYKLDRARMESPSGGISIIRLDKSVMWVLDPKEKTYMEITAEQMKAMAALMKGEIKPEVEKTEETKKIGKYNCTKILVTMKIMGTTTTTEVWGTSEIEPDETLVKFSEKMAEVFKDNPNLQSSNKMMQDIYGMGMFPVQIYTKAKMMGMESENTSTLKSISTDELDDSLFELPEDYTKRDMKSGMGDIKGGIKTKLKDKIK